MFTKNNPRTHPKKLQKLQGLFLGFQIRTPYLAVNNPSISVFKSFFIHKILVHTKKFRKKIRKNPKIPKKSKNSEKIQKFRKNPNIPKKSKNSEKIQTFRKKSKNSEKIQEIQDFFENLNHTLFGSEQLLGPNAENLQYFQFNQTFARL